MATLTIRDVDDALKQRLRIRAAHGNRSMEEEVRQILRAALMSQPQPEAGLAQRVRARFAGLGDVQLPLAEREPIRTPPVPGAEPAAVPRRKPTAGRK
jgi:plasmid stability protein